MAVLTKFLNKHGLKNLKGIQFGSLIVVARVPGRVAWKIRWRCLCVCGKQIVVRHDYLLHTNSPKRHCGCLSIKPQTFGSIHRAEYHVWKMMIARCHNPKNKTYKNYGARGITVCEQWRNSFETFMADMGPRPSNEWSLDRIDPNGNYEPIHSTTGQKQVRWTTQKVQSRNKRKSLFLPHPLTGETVPAAEVAEVLGLTYQQMRAKYITEGKWPGQS